MPTRSPGGPGRRLVFLCTRCERFAVSSTGVIAGSPGAEQVFPSHLHSSAMLNSILDRPCARILVLLTATSVVLAQQDLVQQLEHDLAAERRAAVLAIGKMGEGARKFVPKLVERMTDPDLDVAVAVLDACTHLGQLVVADAASAAAQRDGQALLVTAAVLGHSAHTAPLDRQALLSTLVESGLGSEDQRQRLLAAAAFGAMTDCGITIGRKLLRVLAEMGSIAAPAASRTVTLHGERGLPLWRALVEQQPVLVSPAFVAAIPDRTKEQVALLATIVRLTSGYPRRNALWRIADLGQRAAEHVDVVEAALKASTPGVRSAATCAMARVSDDEDRIAEAMADSLSDPDSLVVTAALDELRSQRLILPRAIPQLVILLGDAGLRNKVISLLARPAHVRRASLLPALEASDPATRVAAVNVLALRGLATGRDLEPLPQWLRAEQTRQQALSLVIALSGAQPKLLPEVINLLRGPYRVQAIDAVSSFRQIGDDATGRLISALKDKDPEVRRAAARALGAVAPGRREVVDALLRGAKDAITGSECVQTIGYMGRAGKAAVEGLCRLLAEPELPHRCDVMRALAAVGDADAIAPLLRVLANGRDDEERSMAIGQLNELLWWQQPVTKKHQIPLALRSVLRALLEVVRTGSPLLRAQAYEALGGLATDEVAQRRLREGLREDGNVLEGVLRGLVRGRLPPTELEIARIADLLVKGPDDVRQLAATVLAMGGRDAHTRLFAAMMDQQTTTRTAAVMALVQMPWVTPLPEEILSTLSTSNCGMRAALVHYFRQGAKDANAIDRLLACWDKAGDNLPLRRTVAEI
ncbi:MAG: hypothetical protein FJX72_09640, partial [Armatimonadetes bacterium]|nr:hypothetical protein [Armatimonadota bacterium]